MGYNANCMSQKKLCNDDGNASRRYYLMSHNTVSTEEVGAVEAPGKTKILIWKILDILIVFFWEGVGIWSPSGGIWSFWGWYSNVSSSWWLLTKVNSIITNMNTMIIFTLQQHWTRETCSQCNRPPQPGCLQFHTLHSLPGGLKMIITIMMIIKIIKINMILMIFMIIRWLKMMKIKIMAMNMIILILMIILIIRWTMYQQHRRAPVGKIIMMILMIFMILMIMMILILMIIRCAIVFTGNTGGPQLAVGLARRACDLLGVVLQQGTDDLLFVIFYSISSLLWSSHDFFIFFYLLGVVLNTVQMMMWMVVMMVMVMVMIMWWWKEWWKITKLHNTKFKEENRTKSKFE